LRSSCFKVYPRLTVVYFTEKRKWNKESISNNKQLSADAWFRAVHDGNLVIIERFLDSGWDVNAQVTKDRKAESSSYKQLINETASISSIKTMLYDTILQNDMTSKILFNDCSLLLVL